MDKEYKKNNGICLKCSDKARIDGLCWWCYQAEYGRRKNVKTGNRVKAEKKANGAVLPMRKACKWEVQMP